MNKFVQLFIALALLASGARANDAGLCKPMCTEEKRTCRISAVKLNDYEASSLTAWKEKNAMAREFGSGNVQTAHPVGAVASSAKDRQMTRIGVCEDKYKSCTKACSAVP